VAEPSWLAEALRLRGDGYSFSQIARAVDAPKSSVARRLETGEGMCPGCGAETDRWSKYCSRACRDAASTTRQRRICRYCGTEFQAQPRKIDRGWAKFCSVRCARQATKPGKRRFVGQRATACQNPACPQTGNGKLEQHHVVYEQHVTNAGGNPGDPRDGITLCTPCHTRHHRRVAPLELSALSDDHYAFAVELFGAPAAYEYLRRYYVGEDERLNIEWMADRYATESTRRA
jgi:hypothetical protein